MCFEGAGKKPIDIVIAIVGEDKSPVADIFMKVGAFEGIELYELVPADIAKRVLKDFVAFEVDDLFLEVDGDGRVFDEGIEKIYGHPLIGVPVSRTIAQSYECKFCLT